MEIEIGAHVDSHGHLVWCVALGALSWIVRSPQWHLLSQIRARGGAVRRYEEML